VKLMIDSFYERRSLELDIYIFQNYFMKLHMSTKIENERKLITKLEKVTQEFRHFSCE